MVSEIPFNKYPLTNTADRCTELFILSIRVKVEYKLIRVFFPKFLISMVDLHLPVHGLFFFTPDSPSSLPSPFKNTRLDPRLDPDPGTSVVEVEGGSFA